MSKMLKNGSKGEAVTALQEQLVTLGYAIKVASTVISMLPLSAPETGQLSLAPAVAAAKASASMPGTFPVTVSADAVIPVPGTSVTTALAFNSFGGVPASAKSCESCMQ